MTQVFTYSRPHKLGLLHDELIAAGVGPLRVEGLGDDIWITVGDGQTQPPVTAVVNAHDPAVLTASEAAELESAADRADLVAQYAAGMNRLDGIVADGPTYAAAQVRDAVVDLARILRRVLRLVRSARL